jgi:hypothetical protein
LDKSAQIPFSHPLLETCYSFCIIISPLKLTIDSESSSKSLKIPTQHHQHSSGFNKLHIINQVNTNIYKPSVCSQKRVKRRPKFLRKNITNIHWNLEFKNNCYFATEYCQKITWLYYFVNYIFKRSLPLMNKSEH